MHADWQVGDEEESNARAAGGDVNGGDNVNGYAERGRKKRAKSRCYQSGCSDPPQQWAIPAAVTVAAAMSSAVAMARRKNWIMTRSCHQ
jgi:hypothetical protein